MAMLLIAMIIGFGCSGKAAAEKAEKERVQKYLAAVVQIVQERAPGTTGKRSDEVGMKAVEEIEAIPTEGVPKEVVDNAKGLASWLRKGIEIQERGELTKVKTEEWIKEGDSLNKESGYYLQKKYK